MIKIATMPVRFFLACALDLAFGRCEGDYVSVTTRQDEGEWF
jgi:hypothetical protein